MEEYLDLRRSEYSQPTYREGCDRQFYHLAIVPVILGRESRALWTLMSIK